MYTAEKYHALAVEYGFTSARFIDDLAIGCNEEFRQYCTPELCPTHGNNWVCPPGCGTIEACSKLVDQYHSGLLLQSITDLTPPVQSETYKALNRAHNENLSKLLLMLKNDISSFLCLTSGGCIFCDSCAYPEPCIHPDLKMNSLSAFGIDVSKLCSDNNLEFSFRPDRVYFTALIMF